MALLITMLVWVPEIYSYMVGYEDPRTDVYFTKAKQSSVEGFYPVFKSLEKVSEYLDRTKYSLLNVQNATPYLYNEGFRSCILAR